MKERDITRTVRDYMELRGWRPVRINAGPFGKSGMPDYLFLHYRRNNMLWIEFKGPNGRLSPHQKRWHEEERARGGRVEVVNDIDDYISWYERHYAAEGQMRLEVG